MNLVCLRRWADSTRKLTGLARQFGAPVRELSALKLRPVEHVNWIVNTPDFEDAPAVIMPVFWCALDSNKYSCLHLFGVKIISLLKAFMTVPQREFPVLWFSKFIRAGSLSSFPLCNAIWYKYRPVWPSQQYETRHWLRSPRALLKRRHTHQLRSYPWGKGNHGMCPCARRWYWCHRARMRLLVLWWHWAPLPIQDEVWARGLRGTEHCCY